jgi:hypothetical protein
MGREVAGNGNSIDMASQDHPLRPAKAGPRDQRVAVPVHAQVRQFAEGGLDRVSQRLLRAAHRLDVDQARGELAGILGKI